MFVENPVRFEPVKFAAQVVLVPACALVTFNENAPVAAASAMVVAPTLLTVTTGVPPFCNCNRSPDVNVPAAVLPMNTGSVFVPDNSISTPASLDDSRCTNAPVAVWLNKLPPVNQRTVVPVRFNTPFCNVM